MQMKNIIIAVAALALGAAVGWFVGGVGERGMGNGRARCPQRADDGGLGQTAPPVHRNRQDARCPSSGQAATPKRKAPIRSSSDVDVQRRILISWGQTLCVH